MDDPGDRARPPARGDRRDLPPKVDGRPPLPGGRPRPTSSGDRAPVVKAAVPAGPAAPAGAVATRPQTGPGPVETADAPGADAPAADVAAIEAPPARRSLFRSAPSPTDPIWLSPADLAPAGIPDVVPVETGRGSPRSLPSAPEPPFVPCDGPYRWEVTLPSAVGRTVTIRVGSTGVELGGAAVTFDDVASVRFKLQVEAALFRRAASARMLVVVTREDGSTVRVAARNAMSTRRAEEIVSVLGYLSAAFGSTASARPRSRMLERIGQGAEVVVGGLRMTRIGVAWKKRPIEPWSAIGDPVVARRSVVIPTSGEPIEVSIAADDAYLLPGLIPELRTRYQ